MRAFLEERGAGRERGRRKKEKRSECHPRNGESLNFASVTGFFLLRLGTDEGDDEKVVEIINNV